MWGISGGGPHVLACAALLPDLVAAAASLASPAPWGTEGLDYFAGMGEGKADDIRLLMADKEAARARWDKEREKILAAGSPAGGLTTERHPRPRGRESFDGYYFSAADPEMTGLRKDRQAQPCHPGWTSYRQGLVQKLTMAAGKRGCTSGTRRSPR
jgi:pimeloyl-ACP methyl ester carboxylesterase